MVESLEKTVAAFVVDIESSIVEHSTVGQPNILTEAKQIELDTTRGMFVRL